MKLIHKVVCSSLGIAILLLALPKSSYAQGVPDECVKPLVGKGYHEISSFLCGNGTASDCPGCNVCSLCLQLALGPLGRAEVAGHYCTIKVKSLNVTRSARLPYFYIENEVRYVNTTGQTVATMLQGMEAEFSTRNGVSRFQQVSYSFPRDLSNIGSFEIAYSAPRDMRSNQTLALYYFLTEAHACKLRPGCNSGAPASQWTWIGSIKIGQRASFPDLDEIFFERAPRVQIRITHQYNAKPEVIAIRHGYYDPHSNLPENAVDIRVTENTWSFPPPNWGSMQGAGYPIVGMSWGSNAKSEDSPNADNVDLWKFSSTQAMIDSEVGDCNWNVCAGNAVDTPCFDTARLCEQETCSSCATQSKALVQGTVTVSGGPINRPAGKLRYVLHSYSTIPQARVFIAQGRLDEAGRFWECVNPDLVDEGVNLSVFATDAGGEKNLGSGNFTDWSVIVTSSINGAPGAPMKPNSANSVYSMTKTFFPAQCEEGETVGTAVTADMPISDASVIDPDSNPYPPAFKDRLPGAFNFAVETANELRDNARDHAGETRGQKRAIEIFPAPVATCNPPDQAFNCSLTYSTGFIALLEEHEFGNDLLAHEYGHHIANRLRDGGGGDFTRVEGWANFYMRRKELWVGHTGKRVFGSKTAAAGEVIKDRDATANKWTFAALKLDYYDEADVNEVFRNAAGATCLRDEVETNMATMWLSLIGNMPDVHSWTQWFAFLEPQGERKTNLQLIADFYEGIPNATVCPGPTSTPGPTWTPTKTTTPTRTPTPTRTRTPTSTRTPTRTSTPTP